MPDVALESLRIAVVGDSGFGEQRTFDLIQQIDQYAPDFLLHTGDVVYKAEEQANPVEAFAKKFFLPFEPILIKAPVYPVVGNHELDAATYWKGLPMYYSAFQAFPALGFESNTERERNSWYGFRYGNYQFLMLDTQTFFNEPGRQEQTDWLRSTLQDQAGLHYSILVTHVPFYSSGPHAQEDVVVRNEWLPLLEGPKVPLVLSGHDHFYERLRVDGRNYIVSGGGSTVLYNNVNPSPFSLRYHKETHFVLLDLMPDLIRARAITAAGEILEDIELKVSIDGN
jgi:acid phosphatase